MATFYFCVHWEAGKLRRGVVDNSNGLYLHDGVADIIRSRPGALKGAGVPAPICHWPVFIGGHRGGAVIRCHRHTCTGRVGALAAFQLSIHWEAGELGVGGILNGNRLHAFIAVPRVIHYAPGPFDGAQPIGEHILIFVIRH